MIVVGGFKGRQVAVLGLAKSGRAAAHSLAAGGAEVLAWDDNPAVRDAVAPEIPLHDLAGVDWRDIPALVLSPGIPLSFPEPHPAVGSRGQPHPAPRGCRPRQGLPRPP